MNAPNEPARAQDGEAARATDGLDLITARIAPQWPWTIRAVAPYVGSPKHLVVTFVHESGEFKPQTMYGTLVDIARRVADDELDKRAVHIDVSTAQLDFEDRNRSAGEYVASPAGDIEVTPHAPATPHRKTSHLKRRVDMLQRELGRIHDLLEEIGKNGSEIHETMARATDDHARQLQSQIDALRIQIDGSRSEVGPLGIEARLYDTEVRARMHDAFVDAARETIGQHSEAIPTLQRQIDVIARGHADLRRDFRDLENAFASRQRGVPLGRITNTWTDPDGTTHTTESVGYTDVLVHGRRAELETEESWTQALSLAKAMTEWAAFRDSPDQPAAVLALCQLANALINAESLKLHRRSVALQSQGVETQAKMFDLGEHIVEVRGVVDPDLRDTAPDKPVAPCCGHPAHEWGECGMTVIDESLSPDRRMTVICTCMWDY